jgi:hypothetical protein
MGLLALGGDGGVVHEWYGVNTKAAARECLDDCAGVGAVETVLVCLKPGVTGSYADNNE